MRIGIAVGSDRIRAVAVRGGRVVAATEAEIGPGEGLDDAVGEILASVPVRRFLRPRVTVALGPSRAQTRRLTGLPPLDDRRVLAQLIREGSSKFFLRNGHPLLTTGVRVEEPGTVWAAALDEPAARAAEAGCRAAGLAVDAFVPSVVALARALEDGRHVWADGAAAAEVEIAGGALTGVRRVASTDGEARPVAALAVLGEHAWRFADAYGAALLPAAEPLAVRRGEGGRRREDVPPWRLALAGTAAVLALSGAAVAPAWRAMQAEDAAAARLATIQGKRRAAADAERELQRVTAALREVAAFDSLRRSPLLALADLARALPEGSALVSVRADSAGGSIVALAPRAAAVLVPLEKVPEIGAAEIVGPVTSELAAGRQVERLTVRFTRGRTP